MKSNRKKRDKKVKDICDKANIKLITFDTKYNNTKDYIINRIKNTHNEITLPQKETKLEEVN